jgi:hypothetical protein
MQYQRGLLFLGVGIALLMLTHQLGDLMIKAMIPLCQWVIHQMDYRFDSTLLNITHLHGENFLQLDVVLSQPFWVESEVMAPNQPIHDSAVISFSSALQPVVITLTIILAWPAKQFITYIYRLTIALPLILLVMSLDMPIQLVNSTWQGIEKNLQFNSQASIANISWFGYLSDFLNGGGLMALSIACGLLAIGLVTLINSNTTTLN